MPRVMTIQGAAQKAAPVSVAVMKCPAARSGSMAVISLQEALLMQPALAAVMTAPVEISPFTVAR